MSTLITYPIVTNEREKEVAWKGHFDKIVPHSHDSASCPSCCTRQTTNYMLILREWESTDVCLHVQKSDSMCYQPLIRVYNPKYRALWLSRYSNIQHLQHIIDIIGAPICVWHRLKPKSILVKVLHNNGFCAKTMNNLEEKPCWWGGVE